jgi:hypothetical protein
MTEAPGYVWALVLIGAVGIPAATGAALFGTARAAGMGRGVAGLIGGGTVALCAGLMGLSAALAAAGLFEQRAGALRPGLPLMFLGSFVVLLGATRIPVVARALSAPGTGARLMLPHTLRVAGAVFVVMFALGRLPAVFALPAGIGDVLVGLAAPLAYRRHLRGAGHAARWFNISGIADLVIAVTIGFMAGLGPSRLLDVAPSTAPVSVLPLALIPTVAVPLAFVVHLTSLRRLAVHARRSPDTQPALG